MGPVDGIPKIGFRRWYERQLIESHAWFVTCFLGIVLLASSIDALDVHEPGWRPVLLTLAFFAGAAACVLAFRRYARILNRAESWGAQSTCAGCGAYGALRVVASSPRCDVDVAGNVEWLDVCCRRCGSHWRMRDDITV